MAYSFKLGTTQAGLTLLSDLTVLVHPPFAEFVPFSKPYSLGDGNVRGNGSPQAKWTWKFMTFAQRDALRVFCTGASTAIWVRTWNDTGVFHDYNGVAIFPTEQDPQASRVLEYVIIFRRLVEYADL